jgi:hypothetical protein
MLGAFQVVAPHISSLRDSGYDRIAILPIYRPQQDLNPARDYMSVAYRSSFRPKSRQG